MEKGGLKMPRCGKMALGTPINFSKYEKGNKYIFLLNFNPIVRERRFILDALLILDNETLVLRF